MGHFISPVFNHPGLLHYAGSYFIRADQEPVASIIIRVDRAEGLEDNPVYSNLWITYQRQFAPLLPGCYVYNVADRKYVKVVKDTGLPDKIYLVRGEENLTGWTPHRASPYRSINMVSLER